MSDEKVLTKEIAEQFLADEESVSLWEFTAIEDDAAESLSKYEASFPSKASLIYPMQRQRASAITRDPSASAP